MYDSTKLDSVCQSLALSDESLSDTVADFLAEAANLAGMNGSGDGIRRRIWEKLKCIARNKEANGDSR